MADELGRYSPDVQLQCVLEVTRQLYDTQKTLEPETALFYWDGDIPLSIHDHQSLNAMLSVYLKRGALRRKSVPFTRDKHATWAYFLPRRRSKLCPYHEEACLPTRETPEHRTEALSAWQRSTHQWPTFLVDLLDPWPRGWDAPVKGNRSVSAITDTLRFHVMQRDRFQCQLCGARVQDDDEIRLTVDHKRSVAMGGTNDSENLWTLCRVCNSGKGVQNL